MFFRPDKPITKHLNHLPHWQQDLVFVFITWRLADSVPEGLLKKWRAEREEWVKSHPKPWDDELGKEYHQRFSAKLEEWMDQGMGECVLRDPCCAEIVGRCLLHFDGERYELDSFVVMPNHVHVLFRISPDYPIEKVVQSWKRYSAREVNELLGKSGQLWHRRFWDTLVRGEKHFWKIRRYIEKNPVKAGLKNEEFLFYLPWKKGTAI
ncbi:MAG: REP element-mobilizing transposase RayT [Akkermansiaceae bacterium]|jgi:REP element-mobilizing transposase RayT